MPKKTTDEKIDALAAMVGRAFKDLDKRMDDRFDQVDRQFVEVAQRLDRIENSSQYTRTVHMSNHKSMSGRRLSCKVYDIWDFACRLELLDYSYCFSRDCFLRLIG